MSMILAANNLTIQLDDDRWKLYSGRGGDGLPVVEAGADGLYYRPTFASARRLPDSGHLPINQIAMVVVGWAVEDSSWHLGLMLDPKVADPRGSRWCGLARWNEYDGDEAERAGRSLASMLNKSFRVVPRPEPRPIDPFPHEDPTLPLVSIDGDVAVAAPVAPRRTYTLMEMPITLGSWILRENDIGLEWERTPHWRTETLIRAGIFVVVTPLFGLLSIGALVSPFARIQPEWLPYIGLVLSAFMLISAISQIAAFVRAPMTIIDRRVRLVRQVLRSRRVIMQTPFESLEYVLVSHVITRKSAASDDENAPGMVNQISAETWIHLYSPRKGFIELCYAEGVEGQMRADLKVSERQPLDLADIDTPAHHAALIMAKEIGIPTYIEER
jgi:hypothetical protein